MSYDVDWPSSEYHEILPNLYLGGHTWREGTRVHYESKHSKVSEGDWDYVVSAYMEPKHEKSFPKCDTRFVFFLDTEHGLEDETWVRIRSAVDEVVKRWRDGQKVLIRCQAGYNRSGMMMAFALMRLGINADESVQRMRRIRGRHVLINHVFEGYVKEHESEYLDESAEVSPEW